MNQEKSDLPSTPGTPAAATRPPTPRWVKIFGIVGVALLVLILVVVVASLAGFGGEHNPARHLGADHPTTATGNHTRPADHHGVAMVDDESPRSDAWSLDVPARLFV
jgi:hypothetical protein